MTVLAEAKILTVEEFMARPDTRDYDLIDGQLVERNVGTRSGYIGGRIITALTNFNDHTNLGWPLPSEVVYQCFGSGHTGRRMDASFVRRGRLPGERIPDGHMTIPPDLAVEVVSPNDLAYEVDDKVALYLKAGVRLIWIVYPESRSIQIFQHPNGIGTRFRHDQEISGEPVIPGFKAPVASFFPPAENVETT